VFERDHGGTGSGRLLERLLQVVLLERRGTLVLGDSRSSIGTAASSSSRGEPTTVLSVLGDMLAPLPTGA
jgi:hypothetical protein